MLPMELAPHLPNMVFFFMYTITTQRFCSGSKLPSTPFSKIRGYRQFQVAEGSQLPSTHFRKIAKKMQLKVAAGSYLSIAPILKLLKKSRKFRFMIGTPISRSLAGTVLDNNLTLEGKLDIEEEYKSIPRAPHAPSVLF